MAIRGTGVMRVGYSLQSGMDRRFGAAWHYPLVPGCGPAKMFQLVDRSFMAIL